MRLLLDENLPKRLKEILPGHEVYTVREMGWQGKKNGELLALMQAERFDALITFDKNLRYQQNFLKFTLAVIVLNAEDNSFITLQKFGSQLQTILSGELKSGPVELK